MPYQLDYVKEAMPFGKSNLSHLTSSLYFADNKKYQCFVTRNLRSCHSALLSLSGAGLMRNPGALTILVSCWSLSRTQCRAGMTITNIDNTEVTKHKVFTFYHIVSRETFFIKKHFLVWQSCRNSGKNSEIPLRLMAKCQLKVGKRKQNS